jgi:hypothetical protein
VIAAADLESSQYLGPTPRLGDRCLELCIGPPTLPSEVRVIYAEGVDLAPYYPERTG